MVRTIHQFFRDGGERAWNSRIVNTWGVLGVRVIQLLLVLPMILQRFEPREVAVWYLFVTVIGLQTFVDFGFAPTFVRLIAAARSDGKLVDLHRESISFPLTAVVAAQVHVYRRLALLALVIMGTLGTLAVYRPVNALADPRGAWIGWGAIVIGGTLTFRYAVFGTILQGLDHIAVQRRVEVLLSLLGVLANLVALQLGGRLLALVLVNQCWSMAVLIANYWLARRLLSKELRYVEESPPDRLISTVWGQAWRSGVGLFLATGLAQASAVVVANVCSPVRAASYLLAVRLYQLLTQFCNAPFYTKIPQMARAFAQEEMDKVRQLAQRGMILSYWSFFFGFACLLLLGPALVDLVRSQTPLPGFSLLAAFGFASLLERIGAMHLQLVTVAHRIIWHSATAGFAMVFVPTALLGFAQVGELAIPLAQVAGYGGFYCWWSMMHSYSRFQLGFPQFELRTSMPVIGAMLVVILMRAIWID